MKWKDWSAECGGDEVICQAKTKWALSGPSSWRNRAIGATSGRGIVHCRVLSEHHRRVIPQRFLALVSVLEYLETSIAYYSRKGKKLDHKLKIRNAKVFGY